MWLQVLDYMMLQLLTLCILKIPKFGTLANSEDPSGPTLFAGVKKIFRVEVHLNLKIIACDPLICIWNYPRFIVSSKVEYSLAYKRLKATMPCGKINKSVL